MILGRISRAEAQRHGEHRGILIVFFVVVLLTGCSEPNTGGNLHGTWINNSNGFITTIEIDTLNKTIEYIDSYKGKIVNNPDFYAVNGVLIIEFTSYTKYEYDHNDLAKPPVITTDPPNTVGWYGALYWRDLKSNSVLMADAYEEFTHIIKSSYLEAQAAFTLDKANNYVPWNYVGTYTK